MFVEAHSILNAHASDDDIVHPFKELEDTCKELVPGSNPGRGANEKTPQIGVSFHLLREESAGSTSDQDSQLD